MSARIPRAGLLVLLVLSAVQLLLIVDVVVVNVALPAIAADLRLTRAELPFTGIAYTLLFGSLLIVGGRAGDAHGRRRVLRAGLVLFLAGSLLAAAAAAPVQLFVARAVQGLGAALISPNALGLLLATFPEGAARNRALGLWAAVGSGGAVLGQLLGGLLTGLAGWPWIFLINVPVAGVALAASTRLLPETPPAARQRLDPVGATLLAVALGSLTIALARLPASGPDATNLALLVSTAALAGGFVAVERRHPNPVLRFSLLTHRSVRTGNAMLALTAGATVGALFFSTLYLQGTLGYPPLAVGVGFAPVTLIVLVASPIAGRLLTRLGARPLLVSGAALAAGGLLLLAGLPPDGSYLASVLPGLALVALGNGLSFAPILATATSGVPEADQGLASGLVNTAQELGSALGLAVLASVAAASGSAVLAGYRWGCLAAAALVATAALIATRVPRQLGQEPTPERAEAHHVTEVNEGVRDAPRAGR
jgi:EmrB/QacA subfamily drug resistance transporter